MGLREILQRNRLEQKDVAEGIGVSRQTVWLWTNGLGVPGGENLARLLAYLQKFEAGLTLADLLPTNLPAAANE